MIYIFSGSSLVKLCQMSSLSSPKKAHPLRQKYPYLELFWSIFFRIRTEYGEIRIFVQFFVGQQCCKIDCLRLVKVQCSQNKVTLQSRVTTPRTNGQLQTHYASFVLCIFIIDLFFLMIPEMYLFMLSSSFDLTIGSF